MKIKFRNKGSVIETDFQKKNLPAILLADATLDGIDLTSYPVIFAPHLKRRGYEEAKEIHNRAPRTIVLYKYEWRNGWGEGIILPQEFTSDKVSFYESEEQSRARLRAIQHKADEDLAAELLVRFSKYCPVKVQVFGGGKIIDISPIQEAFCLDFGWDIKASSAEDAEEQLIQRVPLWKEWNTRALETYMRLSGRENPGNGNIQISPSPFQNNIVGVQYNFNKRRWVIFKKTGGSWEEGEEWVAPYGKGIKEAYI